MDITERSDSIRCVLSLPKDSCCDGVISEHIWFDFPLVYYQTMEHQEVSLTMLMVDGVVAMVMDEDEEDVIVVAVVASVVVTESKTLAAMKRVQVTWSAGLTSWNMSTYIYLVWTWQSM